MQIPFNISNQSFSLYVHIPFCVRKCRYCDFYSIPFDTSLARQYIEALGREWEMMQQELSLQSRSVRTVYIGGGTPSLLDADLWGQLNRVLFSKLDLSDLEEWSVECNPESFTVKKGYMYADTGVTRLTFGVQSLSPRELSLCGRVHTAQRALEVLGDPRLSEWFRSIGVDIIYSLPGQTVESLDRTLSGVLSFSAVRHLSAYELTISPDTPFGRHSKRLPVPSEEHSVEMYELVGKRCRERGMHQYEISNYALDGHESVHNRAYWTHKPYLGLGCSAHSYFHPGRWSNVADVKKYMALLSSGLSPVDFEETIGTSELAREMLFLGLRNAGGLDEVEFERKTGLSLTGQGRNELLSEYSGSGLLRKRGRKWIPTSRGMLFAEGMARNLL
ncbi:MAG: radical SAM family heme chaperone HemW [Fibrobacterota bacterium]